jgi:excisionase family DNA binding protein
MVGNSDRSAVIAALNNLIAETSADQLPTVIGDLAAAEAQAWARITMPAPAATCIEPDAGHMMTADELAKLYRVPKSWFYELARQGRLPCQRLGRYVRFERAVIERALAADSKITALETQKKHRRTKGNLPPATASLPRQTVEEDKS